MASGDPAALRSVCFGITLVAAIGLMASCGEGDTTTVISTTTETETVESGATGTAGPAEETTGEEAPEPTGDGTVPDVTGLTNGEAKLELEAAGYEVTVNKGQYSNLDQPGSVVCTQSPEAGEKAEPGTKVTIVLRKNCDELAP